MLRSCVAQVSSVGKGKAIKYILSLKLGRLFRDSLVRVFPTKVWDKLGIGLHLLDMGDKSINKASAKGRMFLTMSAGFAELKRNLFSERTKAAMQYKKKRLDACSPVNFGYQRIGDKFGALEQEQEVVLDISSLRGTGGTLQSIASMLNGEKIPTKKGGLWYAASVR